MISGMRKDILVAGFLLSIIDRYKGNILVVCPNSFFTISRYTGVVKRRGDDYGVLLCVNSFLLEDRVVL